MPICIYVNYKLRYTVVPGDQERGRSNSASLQCKWPSRRRTGGARMFTNERDLHAKDSNRYNVWSFLVLGGAGWPILRKIALSSDASALVTRLLACLHAVLDVLTPSLSSSPLSRQVVFALSPLAQGFRPPRSLLSTGFTSYNNDVCLC